MLKISKWHRSADLARGHGPIFQIWLRCMRILAIGKSLFNLAMYKNMILGFAGKESGSTTGNLPMRTRIHGSNHGTLLHSGGSMPITLN